MEGIDQSTTRKDHVSRPRPSTEELLTLHESRQRLGEELARARRYTRPLSILELSLEGLDPAHRGAAATLVSQHVRRQDAVGWSTEQRIVAILPETAREGATALAHRLVGALAVVAGGVRAAVASSPTDGCEEDELLSRTAAILSTDNADQITCTTPTLAPPISAPMAHAFRPIDDEVRELERRRMKEALEAAGGNQTRAAMLIAMPLRTFVSKLRVYNLPTGGRKRRTPVPPKDPSSESS